MARFKRTYSKSNSKKSSRTKKYTNAEKIAFRLGQEERVKKSLKSGNTNTRVYDAFCKGIQGKSTNNSKKSLFGD